MKRCYPRSGRVAKYRAGYWRIPEIHLILLIVTIVACSGDERVLQTTVVSPGSVAADELWRSGGVEEAGGLLIESDPMSGAIAPGGIAALVDRRAAAVHLISSEGQLLRSLGRRGHAPGEFQDPRQVGFSGDTLLWVSDAALGRITWFRLDGTIADTWVRGWEPVPRTEWSARGEWVVADKAVFGKVTTDLATADSSPVVAWFEDERLRIHDWAKLPGPLSVMIREKKHGIPIMSMEQPLSSSPILGVPSTGDWFYLLDRAPVTGRDGEISIRRYTATGDRLDEIRIPYRSRPVDAGVREYLDGWVNVIHEALRSRAGTDGAAIQTSDIRREIWTPPALPPVRQVTADAEGFWLLREQQGYPRPTTDDNRWERYGLDGTHLATIQLPTALTVVAVRGSDLLGFTRDSLRVPEIRLYRARMSSSGER